MIVQNAVQIFEQTGLGQIFRSSHVHDYICFELDGEEVMIDGGTEYIRCSANIERLCEENKLIDLTLYDTDTQEKIADKLTWGVRDRKTKEFLGYKFLKQLEDDHLKNILKIEGLSDIYIRTINYILIQRKKYGITL